MNQSDRAFLLNFRIWIAARCKWLCHADVCGVGGLLFVVVLTFYREIFLGQMIWQDDLVTSFFPVRTYTAQVMRAGQLPLWTPYLWGGFPLWADDIATPLYPLHIILSFIPSTLAAFASEYIVSIALAGLFMYGLARALNINALAAFTAGTA